MALEASGTERVQRVANRAEAMADEVLPRRHPVARRYRARERMPRASQHLQAPRHAQTAQRFFALPPAGPSYGQGLGARPGLSASSSTPWRFGGVSPGMRVATRGSRESEPGAGGVVGPSTTLHRPRIRPSIDPASPEEFDTGTAQPDRPRSGFCGLPSEAGPHGFFATRFAEPCLPRQAAGWVAAWAHGPWFGCAPCRALAHGLGPCPDRPQLGPGPILDRPRLIPPDRPRLWVCPGGAAQEDPCTTSMMGVVCGRPHSTSRIRAGLSLGRHSVFPAPPLAADPSRTWRTSLRAASCTGTPCNELRHLLAWLGAWSERRKLVGTLQPACGTWLGLLSSDRHGSSDRHDLATRGSGCSLQSVRRRTWQPL